MKWNFKPIFMVIISMSTLIFAQNSGSADLRREGVVVDWDVEGARMRIQDVASKEVLSAKIPSKWDHLSKNQTVRFNQDKNGTPVNIE